MAASRFFALERARGGVEHHVRWRQLTSRSFAPLDIGRYARVHLRRAAWVRFFLRMRALENFVRCNACRPDGGRLRCGCCWRRTATGVWWQGGYNEHSSRECRLRALEGVSARICAPSITDRMAAWHLVNASHVSYERQLLGQDQWDEQKDYPLSTSGLRDTTTTRSFPAPGAAAEYRLWCRASACPRYDAAVFDHSRSPGV